MNPIWLFDRIEVCTLHAAFKFPVLTTGTAGPQILLTEPWYNSSQPAAYPWKSVRENRQNPDSADIVFKDRKEMIIKNFKRVRDLYTGKRATAALGSSSLRLQLDHSSSETYALKRRTNNYISDLSLKI